MIILSCIPFLVQGFTYVSAVFLFSYVFGLLYNFFLGR